MDDEIKQLQLQIDLLNSSLSQLIQKYNTAIEVSDAEANTFAETITSAAESLSQTALGIGSVPPIESQQLVKNIVHRIQNENVLNSPGLLPPSIQIALNGLSIGARDFIALQPSEPWPVPTDTEPEPEPESEQNFGETS